MSVTEICFNTLYYDLFAVCFGSCEFLLLIYWVLYSNYCFKFQLNSPSKCLKVMSACSASKIHRFLSIKVSIAASILSAFRYELVKCWYLRLNPLPKCFTLTFGSVTYQILLVCRGNIYGRYLIYIKNSTIFRYFLEFSQILYEKYDSISFSYPLVLCLITSY